ncbi:MAG: transketolase family protein [Alphaproteobacteria bacterium]|nr:transketolase family protein [Alphaproteobacteria bacterium]
MKFNQTELRQMANAARARALYGIRNANSGHVGIALGAADIMTAVFAEHLRFNPKKPDWADRDRFVLSAGHGSALLYAVLQLAGYDVIDLSAFRKFDSPLAGHPEYGAVPGVETSTGPLGQGVANAVGMALASKIKKSDARVYCLCSDGDLMEGVAVEAAAFAGRYKLDNLVLLWDDNCIGIDGVALTDIDMSARMAAAGFDTFAVDGNSPKAVAAMVARAKKSKRPAFIKCRTTIGLFASNAGTAAAHGLSLSADELQKLGAELESPAGEKLWAECAKLRIKISDVKNQKTNQNINTELKMENPGAISTREASGKILEQLVAANPTMLGGSADLTESTHTRPDNMRDIVPVDFDGNYIRYGVREHAMAAIMNGLALSGFRPYGGTFLVFSDYMRGAMRLSALMKQPVVYVLSHDSVAVGEDGPTHQPVEQLASLRAIPNMNVLRPADYVETAAAWQMALLDTDRPSCIVLSRQTLPALSGTSLDGAKLGAYIVKAYGIRHKADITLIATGSEVSLALSVAEILDARKIAVQVVSMPSVEKFRLQSSEYRRKMLAGKVIAIEAGTSAPWYEFADAVMGIDTFGRNGPGNEVLKSFGFDAVRIAGDIIKYLK